MSWKRRGIAVIVALTTGLAFASCKAAPSKTTSTDISTEECITAFDANKDYFPDKASFKHAGGITVKYEKSYKVVTLKQTGKDQPGESYILLQCGAPTPKLDDDLAKAQIIQVPVKTVASASTTQLSPIEILDRAQAIKGVSSGKNVSNERYRERIAKGDIKEFGNESGEIDVEKVVALKPDLTLQSGMDKPEWKKIKEMKVPVIADAAWLENAPLARAEWVKYFSLFFNQEKKADQVFGEMEKKYNEVKKQALSAKDKTPVLAGQLYKGDWLVPGKDSYVVQFINDAGGSYVLPETDGNGSRNVDGEKVIAAATKAKVWINGNGMGRNLWKTKADVLAADSRLGKLAPVASGQIWNPTKKIGAGGGNMYWEDGVIHPDLILKDLAWIFHPELFPGYDGYYYNKVAD